MLHRPLTAALALLKSVSCLALPQSGIESGKCASMAFLSPARSRYVGVKSFSNVARRMRKKKYFRNIEFHASKPSKISLLQYNAELGHSQTATSATGSGR